MLIVDDLRVCYGPREAVGGVSFAVGAGEVYGLLGPNGAGKSTTIAACVGLIRPTGGQIRIGPERAAMSARARRHLGLCPQDIAIYDGLTATENLVFFGRAQGLSASTAKTRATELLERVGLTERGRDKPGAYSGGMKRRLNLAIALMHDPPIVLLDEPTVGVDPQSRHSIFELVMELRSSGKAVLYTTHYMEEAERLCDRIGIIDHGRLLAEGTLDELTDAHGGGRAVVVRTREGETRHATEDPVGELVRLREAGPKILSAKIVGASLEDVFLDLTGRSLRD